MGTTALTDEALLAGGDPAAFERFYLTHVETLLGFFARRTGDPELAADLTAETFAAALIGVGRFDPARGPALAWTFGIARNKLRHAWEKRRVEDRARRKLGMPPLVLEDETLDRIERLGAEDRVVALLQTLPGDQAQAIRARIIDEQPYSFIAAEVRCSESVIRQRVSRGLAALRSTVKESP